MIDSQLFRSICLKHGRCFLYVLMIACWANQFLNFFVEVRFDALRFVEFSIFGYIFFQDIGGPDPELRCPAGIDTVSDRDDSVKVIEISLSTLRFAFYCSVWGGYFHFGNNHIAYAQIDCFIFPQHLPPMRGRTSCNPQYSYVLKDI